MNRSIFAFATLALTLAGCPSDPVTPGTDSGPSGVDAPAAVDTGGGGTDAPVAPVDAPVVVDDAPVATTDAPTPVGGACTNAADGAALPMSHMGMTLQEHTQACAMMNLAPPDGTRAMRINDCIQSATRVNGAISSACTLCFAAAAACTIQSCLTSCIGGPTSTLCVDCQCTNCAAAYGTCSGIPDSRCTP